MDAHVVAWGATLGCVLVTARAAAAFAEPKPRLFTVLSLFSLSWAILLPYYGTENIETELLPALNGFVLVYVGILLRREGEAEQKLAKVEIMDPHDSLALLLLLALAAPSFLSFSFAPTSKHIHTIESWIGTSLTLLGFLSISVGMKRLYKGSRAWIWMAVVFAISAFFELRYSWLSTRGHGMTDTDRWIFAVCKCVITLLFLTLVLRKIVSHKDRRPWWRIPLKLAWLPV